MPNYPTCHQQYSAENFLAFMELRNNIDHLLLNYFNARGLILTDINHILNGLYRTFMNLGIHVDPPH